MKEIKGASMKYDYQQVVDKLLSYADGFLGERNIVQTNEVIILKGKAVHTAYLNLEMRYTTYAEDSWVALVLQSVETKNCVCDDCQLWYMREVQIINEVSQCVDRAITKMNQGDKICY
jgi:hypothetical protein